MNSRASKNWIYQKLGKYSEMIQGFAKKMTTPKKATQKQYEDMSGDIRLTKEQREKANDMARFMMSKRK